MLLSKTQRQEKVNVLIITGSCCLPGMAALDEEAKKLVVKAANETNTEIELKVLPVSKAMFGGVPRDIAQKLVGEFNASGKIGLPAIIVNGKLASYSVIDYEAVKNAISNS